MTALLDSDIAEICTTLGPSAREFAGKRILITGARGFLGRYFTDVFVKLNETVLDTPCEIIAIDNLITAGAMGAEAEAHRHVAFVNHDIIKPFYPERPVSFVLHAAGIASPYYYRKWPLETLEEAPIGLQTVLELPKASSARVLFFSSSEIYSNPDSAQQPTKESYHSHENCLGPR